MAKIELTTETIKELTEMLKSTDLGKIQIKSEDFEICLEAKKTPAANTPPSISLGATDAVAAVASAEEKISGNLITSPIIGTYYAAPAPEKDPYVRVGQNVKKGDVLFIVESMKLMNEIQSDFDGVVKQIFVENGEGVEFGQKIMVIE